MKRREFLEALAVASVSGVPSLPAAAVWRPKPASRGFTTVAHSRAPTLDHQAVLINRIKSQMLKHASGLLDMSSIDHPCKNLDGKGPITYRGSLPYE